LKRAGEPMKDNFIIENLIKMGLIKSEATIYLNMLKKQSYTASELSRISNISRPKTYEVLNQLVKKGLCIEILGSVKKYAAVNPETAFNGLKQEIKQELENKQILLSDLKRTLLSFYNSKIENGVPLDYIQVIRDKNSIIKKFESLEKIATQEVLSLVKGPSVMNVTKQYNLEQYNSLKRGVNFKTIYEIEFLKNKFLFESIEAFASAGEEVRIADKLSIPFKMYIYDEKTVMFTLEDEIASKSKLTSLIIEHPDLAKGLKQVFNLYWQNSMTLEEYKKKEKV